MNILHYCITFNWTGQCLVPSIPNATLDKREGEYARHGDILNYQCQHGRVPDDTNPVRCDNGTWTSVPRCTPGKIITS